MFHQVRDIADYRATQWDAKKQPASFCDVLAETESLTSSGKHFQLRALHKSLSHKLQSTGHENQGKTEELLKTENTGARVH